MYTVVKREFDEIKYPKDMLPIVTKDKSILWFDAKFVNTKSVGNIDVLLYDKFTEVFNKLKIYIDTFNFTYFMYEKEIEFININSEEYDKQYGLNNDLMEKLNSYKNDLKRFLNRIHEEFNEYNRLLEIDYRI